MRNKIVLALLAVVLGASAATAHPRLQTSVPVPEAKLSASPGEIRLHFSEGLVANFSGLELKDGKGKAVATGKAALAPGDDRTLVVPVKVRLGPGIYTVGWHAVSVDTHRVTGAYRFKVGK